MDLVRPVFTEDLDTFKPFQRLCMHQSDSELRLAQQMLSEELLHLNATQDAQGSEYLQYTDRALRLALVQSELFSRGLTV